jgi:hypothetical protein
VIGIWGRKFILLFSTKSLPVLLDSCNMLFATTKLWNYFLIIVLLHSIKQVLYYSYRDYWCNHVQHITQFGQNIKIQLLWTQTDSSKIAYFLFNYDAGNTNEITAKCLASGKIDLKATEKHDSFFISETILSKRDCPVLNLRTNVLLPKVNWQINWN